MGGGGETEAEGVMRRWQNHGVYASISYTSIDYGIINDMQVQPCT